MNTKPPLQCVIVEDEPLALSLLSDYVNRTAGLHLSAAISNPLEALKYLEENETDLLFLDVQMPDLTGIQLLKILRRQPAVVLTTAYPQYAIDGFEHDVWDYLLKPVSFDRFLLSINKIKERLLTRSAPTTTTKDYLFIKSENKVIKLNYNDILYLEGMRDYVCFNTLSGKVLTLQSLSSFELELPAEQFLRIHKSFIIHLNKIQFIEKGYIAIGKARLPIGSVYEARVRDIWKK